MTGSGASLHDDQPEQGRSDEITLGSETFRRTDMGWLWIYDIGSNYDFPLAFDCTINTVQPWRRLGMALDQIERLRKLLDAVVEEFDPSCHCDHYPRNDCPCARVRKLLDGAV